MARLNVQRALRNTYGPWALVAGASEGLGAAFAELLASLGFNVVLVARRKSMLESLASGLETDHGVTTRCVVADLGREDAVRSVLESAADLDIGLMVYNAAHAPIGFFADREMEDLTSVVHVNARGPVQLIHTLLPQLLRRVEGPRGESAARRSGIILMSSLSGDRGSPRVATYAASKAFTTILAQGLWHELRDRGVDVTACVAGAIRTPGYSSARDGSGHGDAPGTLDAHHVATAAIRGLGRGPVIVPGVVNRLARFLMGRLLPVRLSVRLMAASTRGLGDPVSRTNQMKDGS